MKKFVFIILIIFTSICSTCIKHSDVYEYTIWIKNNSNQPISYFVSRAYPDTTLSLDKPYISKLVSQARDFVLTDTERQDIYFRKEFTSDTLLLFIFNPDTINKYDWETIRKGYKIMEKRTYSKTDLEKANWYIYYQ